ncbi:MAG: UTP--glucose-1-phosphate uridylyltransferase, partial [Bilophila sp.]
DMLKTVRDVAEMVNIMSVRQKRQLGLGHAVLCAREMVRGESFAVMVGDDLMFGADAGLEQLVKVASERNMPTIGVMEVPADKVNRYGIATGEEIAPGVYNLTGMVEKPAVGTVDSRLAIVGRYVLTPDIFDHLEKVQPGHGGEIQLTDALASLARERGMLAVKMGGIRFDAGDWVDYLSANIYFGLMDKAVAPALREKLREMLG